MTNLTRPLSVEIVAILELISGCISLVGGLLFIAFASFFSSVFPALAGIGIFLGGILVLVGAASLLLGFGLLRAKGWARSIALALSVLGLVMGGISMTILSSLGVVWLASSIPTLAVNVLVIYFLTRPAVEAYFRQSRTREFQAYPPLFGVPRTSYGPSYVQRTAIVGPIATTPICPVCGQSLGYVEQYRRWYCYYCSEYR
jgi:hypothetical protein